MPNQFDVRVPNAMEAFLGFDQSYKDTRQSTARQQAAQMIQSGGDPKAALGILLGAGATQDAAAYGTIANNESQRAFQDKSLAETIRAHDISNQQAQAQNALTAGHYKALEGQAAATLAETRRQHEVELGKPIPVDTLGGTRFLVRGPGGAMNLVDPSALAGQRPSMPPVSPSQPAPLPGAPTAAPALAPSAADPAAAPGAPQPATALPVDLETVDPKSGRREGYLKNLPPDVQDYIKKVADYEIDPRTSSTKGGKREQLLSAVAKYDPAYDQNVFSSRQKANRDFATGSQGNTVRSFDVAIDHLETLDHLGKALKNGDSRLINSLSNSFKDQFGYPAPSSFEAAKTIIGGEIAKAVTGSNNALADREELRSALKAASSPDQLSGVIDTYKKLMAGQLKGLKKQYEDTVGRKDFDSRLRDSTRKQLLSPDEGAASGENATTTGVKWKILP